MNCCAFYTTVKLLKSCLIGKETRKGYAYNNIFHIWELHKKLKM
jgi:hypothetical protein